jgi:hypothetical protein
MMKPILIAVAAVILTAGCGDHQERVEQSWHQQSSPASNKLPEKYEVIYGIERDKMGFPALPTSGSVKVERIHRDTWAMEYPPPNYDVMLHFYDQREGHYRQATTVGLKKKEGRLIWIGEQHTLKGPKTYTTVDGTFNEQITITFETEQMAYVGTTLTGTAVTYSGPDGRLAGKSQHADNLTITQVAPILREWGYSYEADRAQGLQATR